MAIHSQFMYHTASIKSGKPSRHILIIDDNDDDREAYAFRLSRCEKHDYHCVLSSTLLEAEQMLRKYRFDCVLLDYRMRDGESLGFLGSIQKRYPYLPIIMMSGIGNEKIAANSIKAGACDYIRKEDVTTPSLLKQIDYAISHSQLQHKLARQADTLRIFTRALAHDLKEPLRTILSFTELVMKKDDLAAETRQNYLEKVKRASEHMQQLLVHVGSYTRFETSEDEAFDQFEVIALDTLLRSAQNNLEQLIRESNATIELECPETPRVWVQKMPLVQLLQNLIANAIHYTPDGETPHIHLVCEHLTESQQWDILFYDKGDGISPDFVANLFTPFKRGVGREKPGSGLGLSICSKIAEIHHSSLAYEPGPTGGAGFRFTLNDHTHEIHPKENCDD